MQLTKKASYGLIAAFELARSSDSTPLSASSIAQRYALPVPFVEKILHRLRQSGLVASRQGRSGGYTLAADPKHISVRQVLEALDESLDLVGCLGTDTCCNLTDICPTKPAWSVINRRFHALLDALSLEDLHNSDNLALGDPESRTGCKESSAT